MHRSPFSRLIPCIAALCVSHVAASARPIVTGPKAIVPRVRPVAVKAPTATKTTTPAPADSPFPFYWSVSGRFANTMPVAEYPMLRQDVVCIYEHRLGLFPRIVNGRIENGGIPQRTNLAAHLEKAKRDIEAAIPDATFAGLAIIDYEAWTPIWSRTGDVYRTASRDYTRQRNPSLTGDALEQRAKQEFCDAGDAVMLETLRLGKRLRPNAKWGFYGYPDQHRPEDMREIPWMWEESDAAFPAFYNLKYGVKTGEAGPGQIKVADFENEIRLMIDTSKTLTGNKPVYGFIWVRYHEVNRTYGLQMLNPDDLEQIMNAPRALGAQGLIVWDHIDDPAYAPEAKRYYTDKALPALKRAYDLSVTAAAAAASKPSTALKKPTRSRPVAPRPPTPPGSR